MDAEDNYSMDSKDINSMDIKDINGTDTKRLQQKTESRRHKSSAEMERRDAEFAQLVQQAETMHLKERLSQRVGRTSHDMVFTGPCCPGVSHHSPGVPCHSNQYMGNPVGHRVCHHHSVSTTSPPSSINSCEDDAFMHECENTNRINSKREQTRSQRSSRK